MPVEYYGERFDDIQSRCSHALILTDKKGSKQTNCCLEIVITEDEKKEALKPIGNGWYIFLLPLPITRVKKVLFESKEQLQTTIGNIEVATAFVPNKILEVCGFADNQLVESNLPQNIDCKDWSGYLEKYNRFLGALALMRVAIGEERYMSYSPNYISTVSFFNKEILSELEKNGIEIKDAYQGLFAEHKSFEKILPYLKKEIDEALLYKMAKEETVNVKKDSITRLIKIEGIAEKTWTYVLAYLLTYGVVDEGKKKITELIFSRFSLPRGEGIALCYGYNRGYGVFNKAYGLSETDIVNVKYRLESQLDYYTIESVYQYVFNNNRVSATFPYLDEWCPKLQGRRPRYSNEYMILDEVIVGKKKAPVFSEDWWKEFGITKKIGEIGSQIINILLPYFAEIRKDIEEEVGYKYDGQIERQRQGFAQKEKVFQQKMIENEKEIVWLKEQLEKTKQEKKRIEENRNREDVEKPSGRIDEVKK